MNPFQPPPTDRVDDRNYHDVGYQRDNAPRHILAQRRMALFAVVICLFVGTLLMFKVDHLLRQQQSYLPFPLDLILVIFPLPGTCLLVLRRYLWPQLDLRELGGVLVAGCGFGYFVFPFIFHFIALVLGWPMF